jgi:hypothetical protein
MTTKRADPTQGVLDYLQHCLPAYPFNADLDKDFVDEILADFPRVDLLEEIKAFRWYYANGTSPNPRLARIRLRRWLHNAKESRRS